MYVQAGQLARRPTIHEMCMKVSSSHGGLESRLARRVGVIEVARLPSERRRDFPPTYNLAFMESSYELSHWPENADVDRVWRQENMLCT